MMNEDDHDDGGGGGGHNCSENHHTIIIRCTISGGLEPFAEEEIRRVIATTNCFFGGDSVVDLSWVHKGNSGSVLHLICRRRRRREMDEDRGFLAIISGNILPNLIQNLHFVDFISIQLLSKDTTTTTKMKSSLVVGEDDESSEQNKLTTTTDTTTPTKIKKWITDQCLFNLHQDIFDNAMKGWVICKTLLDKVDMPIQELEGELIQMPPTTLTIINDDDKKNYNTGRSDEEEQEEEEQSSILKTTETTTTTTFHTNTIYTRQHVAKMAVDMFLYIVQKELLSSSTTTATSINHLNNSKKILYLDAGAGSGALLQHLPVNASIGVDLDPPPPPPPPPPTASSRNEQQNNNNNNKRLIYQKDFFHVTSTWLLQQQQQQQNRTHDLHEYYDNDTLLCIISNPPFGQTNRGDYTIISKFLQHSFSNELQAKFVGLIVPEKFAHVWKSLLLLLQPPPPPNNNNSNANNNANTTIRLRYRMHLPKDSFYDPSTSQIKHVKCYLLIFDNNNNLAAPAASPPPAVQSSTLPSSSSPPHHNISTTPTPTQQQQQQQQQSQLSSSSLPSSSPTIHITAQRDKGLFPGLSTADFTLAVVHGLGRRGGVPLGSSSKTSDITVRARLGKTLELFLELNTKRPLSITNSISRTIQGHSLGWMSKSVKPPVALAMNHLSWFGVVAPIVVHHQEQQQQEKEGQQQLQREVEDPRKDNQDNNNNKSRRVLPPGVTVNLMCGEGTLEFESMHDNNNNHERNGCYFHLVGDKNVESLQKVKNQVSSFSKRTLQQQEEGQVLQGGGGGGVTTTTPPIMDFVLWDAQNLPLRRGIADSVFADLPFAGSNKKKHQEPSTQKKNLSDSGSSSSPSTPPPPSYSSSSSLSYPNVLASIVRVLTPSTGRAILVSADTKALTHSIWKFAGTMKEVWQSKLNIGGLSGRLSLLSRKSAAWKDVNVLVPHDVDDDDDHDHGKADYSAEILQRARESCSQYCLDRLLELQEIVETSTATGQYHHHPHLVQATELQSTYYSDGDEMECHTYRIIFDPMVSNINAKTLEKVIRLNLDHKPIEGTRMP